MEGHANFGKEKTETQTTFVKYLIKGKLELEFRSPDCRPTGFYYATL